MHDPRSCNLGFSRTRAGLYEDACRRIREGDRVLYLVKEPEELHAIADAETFGQSKSGCLTGAIRAPAIRCRRLEATA